MPPAKANPPTSEFKLYTDADAMKTVFQSELPGYSDGLLIITECTIRHVRYKPHRKRDKVFLAVCYEFEVTEPCTQKSGCQIVYAKVYREGRSHSEFQAAQHTGLSRPEYGEALVHLPQHDMLVWSFPNDPILVHLTEVIDPHKVKQYIPYRRLPPCFDRAQSISVSKTDVVNYRPEERCIVRYRLQSRSSGQPKTITIFGKTYKDQNGKRVLGRIDHFWQASLKDKSGITVARPLGYNASVKTVWQAELESKSVLETINHSNHDYFARAIAHGLATVHRNTPTDLANKTVEDHIIEVKKKAAKLTRAFPHLKERLGVLGERLTQNEPDCSQVPQRPIYWDFHIDQLQVQANNVAFFDFDELSIGDPVQDVANFIVDLYFRHLSNDFVKRLATKFYRYYCQEVAWPVPIDRLRWHLRVQFINKAYRHYIQQKPYSADTLDKILRLAEEPSILVTLAKDQVFAMKQQDVADREKHPE